MDMPFNYGMYVLCTPQIVAPTGLRSGDSVDVQGHQTVAEQTNKLLHLVRKKHLGSLVGWKMKSNWSRLYTEHDKKKWLLLD